MRPFGEREVMDYRKSAQEVLDNIGGAGNVVSAAHCATRLRLVIADNAKVDKDALENIDGAKGVFEAQGQLQIIFGTGTVNKVYEEFIALSGVEAATKAEVKEAAAQQQNIFMRAIKVLGDVFVPIIPAIDLGQLAQYGVTYWLPIASAANIAQGGAALAVAFKTRDAKIKGLALPSALSAFMGITEPAIFGVNLRFFKPFIAGCIGGGCGALVCALTSLAASGTGVTGIFGILLCLAQPVQYAIMFAVAALVSFAVSFVLYKDESKTSEQA